MICVVGLIYETEVRNRLQDFIDKDSNKLNPDVVTRSAKMLQNTSMVHADDLYKILDIINLNLGNKVRQILNLETRDKSQQSLFDSIVNVCQTK